MADLQIFVNSRHFSIMKSRGHTLKSICSPELKFTNYKKWENPSFYQISIRRKDGLVISSYQLDFRSLRMSYWAVAENLPRSIGAWCQRFDGSFELQH